MAAELFTVVKTDVVKVRKQELGFEGDWDVTNWHELNRVVQALMSLQSDVLKLPRDAFKASKILQIDENCCLPLVACHITEVGNLDDSTKLVADDALEGFLALVLGKQPPDHFQYLVSESSSSRNEIIGAHAKQFLKAHGSKRLTSSVLVRGSQAQVTLRGRYAPKPSHGSPQSTPYVVEGVMDSLEISGRAFVILQGSKMTKQLIRYDELEHFDMLHSFLGNPAKMQFNVREVRNRHKISMELVEILGAIDDCC